MHHINGKRMELNMDHLLELGQIEYLLTSLLSFKKKQISQKMQQLTIKSGKLLDKHDTELLMKM